MENPEFCESQEDGGKLMKGKIIIWMTMLNSYRYPLKHPATVRWIMSTIFLLMNAPEVTVMNLKK